MSEEQAEMGKLVMEAISLLLSSNHSNAGKKLFHEIIMRHVLNVLLSFMCCVLGKGIIVCPNPRVKHNCHILPEPIILKLKSEVFMKLMS